LAAGLSVEMKLQKEVAIIGAGIAGLSCATALQKSGCNVTVFEKSRGVSGRLSTRVTQATALNEYWQCDHGAQYFTARDPIFNAEVQRWIQADVAQLWQARLTDYDGHHFSIKEGETDRYVGYPRNSSPAKWLAQSLNIHTETTITHLQKYVQHWQITSKEHGEHVQQFDSVFLAIPAPQAAVLLKNVAPVLYDVAAKVKMQACFALMLNIESTVNCDFDGLFINNGLLSWIARDSAKPGRHNAANNKNPLKNQETWVLHASSQWSEMHVDDDKETIAQQMLAEFLSIIALKDATVPMLQISTLHHWLYADCDGCLNSVYEFDAQHNIGLCGDWLNGGKVQGAWLSGLMLAKQIIAVI
jgi:hypothetical protein